MMQRAMTSRAKRAPSSIGETCPAPPCGGCRAAAGRRRSLRSLRSPNAISRHSSISVSCDYSEESQISQQRARVASPNYFRITESCQAFMRPPAIFKWEMFSVSSHDKKLMLGLRIILSPTTLLCYFGRPNANANQAFAERVVKDIRRGSWRHCPAGG